MRRAVIAVALLIPGLHMSYAAERVFEKGDALYRPKRFALTGVLFGHAALYLNSGSAYRFTREQALAEALPDLLESDIGHSVIQAPGSPQSIQIATFADFKGSQAFWGAYSNSNHTARRRHNIVIVAGQQLETPYTLFSHWKGPDKFRCDGFVSFAYAHPLVGTPISENEGGWLTNFPRTQRNRLTLRTSAQGPSCQPAARTPSGSNFVLSTSLVRDDASGSGVDRVEFYNGNPASGGAILGKDDHDSNAIAGLPGSDSYSVNSSVDPGANLYTRVYDQAGNFATCSIEGTLTGTSDLAQNSPNVVEDVTPPTIGTIDIPPDNQTVTASWSGTDDQTPANQINYAYAVDVPFDQWDDPDVTILGAQTSVTIDAASLAGGQHTLYLIALDQEGNIGSASVSFTAEGPQILNEELLGAVFKERSFNRVKRGLLREALAGISDARAQRTGWRPSGETHDRPALDASRPFEARPTPAPFARPGIPLEQLVTGRLGRWPSLRGTAVPAAPHVAGRSFEVQPCPLAQRRLVVPSGHGFVFDLSAFSISAARRSGPRLAVPCGDPHDRRAPAQLAVNGHGYGNDPVPAVVMPGVGGFAWCGPAAGWPRPAFMARPCRFLCEQVAALAHNVQRRAAEGGAEEFFHSPQPQRRPGCAGTEVVLYKNLSTVSTKFTARRRRGAFDV